MKEIIKFQYVFLLILFLTYGEAVNAQCDKSLKPEETIRGYTARSSVRYEGFYISKVSSGSLNIVGVTLGKFRFKCDANEMLNVSSPIVKDEVVNIQAVGIPLKTYYRMDAVIDQNGSLTWPVGDVLYPAGLQYKNIGVFGWIGSRKNKTYVPIEIASSMLSTTEETSIYVYLRASIDVMNVRWRFANVLEDGTCAKADAWIRPKKQKYRSGDRIVCKVPYGITGEVCITVKAESQEGDVSLRCKERIILN